MYSPLQLRLNPCCNGICSKTCIFGLSKMQKMVMCLNPCCNGICSKTLNCALRVQPTISLNPCCNGICSKTPSTEARRRVWRSLNPCCNGICSKTQAWKMTKSSIPSCLNPCCNGICSKTLNFVCGLFLTIYKSKNKIHIIISPKKSLFLSGCKGTNKKQHVKERFR